VASLPKFYIDNVNVIEDDTTILRGNTVSNIYGNDAIGIEVKNCKTLRAKDNKVNNVNSMVQSSGMYFNDIDDALILYSTASRCDYGFRFDEITSLSIYNLTAHNCLQHVTSSVDGTLKNVCLSNYDKFKHFEKSIGLVATSGTLDVDYIDYYGLDSLYSGNVTVGSNVYVDKPIYLDEQNDDLTPDYISILVNTGTDNPLRIEDPCIGGVESEITDEDTAKRNYIYDLLDNHFWLVGDDKSAEMSLVKAFQSRILAGSELIEKNAERDYYIKTARSVIGFSELYPMYARYANTSKFKKRVMDMWFSGQNVGTLQAYNNGIGGYNLLPSFFKRLEDWPDYWIIGESFVGHDNYLLGNNDQYYGIGIDTLGISTLTKGASAECYKNVQECVSDIAPVRWSLHEEVQPPNYILFSDMYNNFNHCTLTNMIYNDDFNINIDIVQQDGVILSPLISTLSLSASGETEISVLERVYSENVIRKIYYRTGVAEALMGSWSEIKHTIGGVLSLNDPYVQFRINVSGVLRQIDYEFMGLCLRPHESSRVWTDPLQYKEIYVEFEPGAAVKSKVAPPLESGSTLEFKNDGIQHTCTWCIYVPKAIRTTVSKIRLNFATLGLSYAGIARVMTVMYLIPDTYALPVPVAETTSVELKKNEVSYIDLDISSMNANTELIYLMLARDSSDPLDNLAASLLFINGRTING